MFRSSIRAALLLAAVTVMCQAAFPTVASAQATPVATDTAARRIVLKLDPPFFFTGGYGGALGIRHRGLEVGVMGFSAPLPAVFRDQFLSNAKGRTVTRNIGLELYAQKDVAQWRWPISVETGIPEKIDVPRSPFRIAHSQVKKRTWKGRSKPSTTRTRWMSSTVARSPAMIAAGSPGEK
jgi:hypothetical protein